MQKLSEADKLYSSSAAAYMSDPRLCHTTALRLGTATPTGGGDSKHGKQEATEHKLPAVKEEETGVESGQGAGAGAGAGDSDYLGGRVTAVTWCDNIIQTELGVGVAADPALAPATIYMCPAPEQPRGSPLGPAEVGGAAAGSEGGGVASTCCSVFSLSECCVVAGVGAAPGPAHPPPPPTGNPGLLPVPVSEVRCAQPRVPATCHVSAPPHHCTPSFPPEMTSWP